MKTEITKKWKRYDSVCTAQMRTGNKYDIYQIYFRKGKRY